MSSSTGELYEFDSFRLDVSERTLWRSGERLPLPEKAFDTLCVLVRSAGHLVTKENLLDQVWPDTIVEENSVAKTISLLRKALGFQPNGDNLIETVRGHGFRFVGVVRRSSSPIPVTENAARPGVVSSTPVRDNGSAVEGQGRFWLFAIALVSLIGLIFVVAYSPGDERSPGAPITSVAVLPFVNAGADPEIEYLSDGISESLIDRLSELPQLKVIARTSSFKYRGENVDVQDAANKLGVEAIVAGRLVRRGDDLSVRVELIDARDNHQLWGGEFSRKATDALFLQSEIARTVSERMRLKLSGPQEQQLSKHQTAVPEAYDLLLKARFQRNKGDDAAVTRAVNYLEQAVAADPQYALAYAELSTAYSLVGNNSILDPKEVAIKAESAARTALKLDENLAEGHVALAVIRMNAWDWKTAEREYLEALELNPNLSEGLVWYSSYLSVMGRHGQAITIMKRAKDVDPLSLRLRVAVGSTYSLARQYDQALEILQEALEMDRKFTSTHEALAFSYMGKEMHREAIAEFQEAHRLSSKGREGGVFLGVAYAKGGQREKALAILKQLESGERYVAPGELALLYISLGQREKAFASLEKAYASHDLQLQYLNVDPLFDELRDDRRFQDLLQRVGLSQ